MPILPNAVTRLSAKKLQYLKMPRITILMLILAIVHNLPPQFGFLPFYLKPTDIATEGGKGYENQASPVPPSIEHITRHHYQQVLPA